MKQNQSDTERFKSWLTVVRRIVRGAKTLHGRRQVRMMRERVMVEHGRHRKGISGVAGDRIILAWWRVMIIAHRRVRIVIRRYRIIAGVTVWPWCRRQLHEGGLARRGRLKVFGLEVEVHVAALTEERFNYNKSALADVTSWQVALHNLDMRPE